MRFIFILLGFLFITTQVAAQNIYYQGPNGKIISQEQYEKLKENLSKNSKVEEIITSTRTPKDSIIKVVTLKTTPIDSDGPAINPFEVHEKKIGQHFVIEKFKTKKGKNYSKIALNGKPTFINFWFTRCPPCIAEIPNLNSLKNKYGNKVNFIAITFDDEAKVKEFLSKKDINFEHITDAKQQLKDMEIEAYPMNFLLDKNGNIVNVFSEISSDENNVAKQIDILLKK